MGNFQNSRDECEKFLARQKPWVQAVLKGEHGSPDILPALAEPGGIKELHKVQDEYEELLKRCPKHLRQYRKHNAALHLGPIRSRTSSQPPSAGTRAKSGRAIQAGQVMGRNCSSIVLTQNGAQPQVRQAVCRPSPAERPALR